MTRSAPALAAVWNINCVSTHRATTPGALASVRARDESGSDKAGDDESQETQFGGSLGVESGALLMI